MGDFIVGLSAAAFLALMGWIVFEALLRPLLG
jgi:hypothetical protein